MDGIRTCSLIKLPVQVLIFDPINPFKCTKFHPQFSERILLVTSPDGIFRLALDGQSPLETWDLLNVSAPELIAHDPVSGELFWVVQGMRKKAVQIYRHDFVSGNSSLALEVQFNGGRPGAPGKPTGGASSEGPFVVSNYIAIM